MVTPSVFDRSEVNCFHQTDLKASLESRRPNVKISKNICQNIKESADSKYCTNILYQVALLVRSPKPLKFHKCTREYMCNNCVKFHHNRFSRLAVHKGPTDIHSFCMYRDKNYVQQ